jgi:hypothetical protein
MTEKLLCKDCKYFHHTFWSKLRGVSNEHGKCTLEKLSETTFDYVNGKEKVTVKDIYADFQRGHYGKCGDEGKFWVSDKKKHLFTLLKKI